MSSSAAVGVITGAIFDCDGTLVDSMPMWNAIVEDAFDAYGIEKDPALLAEAEAFNFDDMCFWFHERFGIGESGEAVLAGIRAEVQGHYMNDIALFDGCREFLDELRAAGVRMLILSATTEPEVWVALRAQGIDGYFERICGSNNLHGASKVVRARAFLAELRSRDAEAKFVMIGDAVHDKEVSDAIGIPCVLCAVGSHAAWRLRAVAPTGDTLVDALKLALNAPAKPSFTSERGVLV